MGRRVRRETGWRSLACTVCGPDTTHALIRSGTCKWWLVGPPAGAVSEYARCLSCSTRRSVDDEVPPPSWSEARGLVYGLPISVDPR